MTTLNAIQYSVKHEVFDDSEIKDIIYNTRERIQIKFSFNSACSGKLYVKKLTKVSEVML